MIEEDSEPYNLKGDGRMGKPAEIEVDAGPMGCGKTENLIMKLMRAKAAGQTVIAFKPSCDTRYEKDKIVSLSGYRFEAISVDKPEDILTIIEQIKDVQVVGIDEIQFFPKEIVEVADDLANKGIRVIAVGLDLNFRGEPFISTSLLMAKATKVNKLFSICAVCGAKAHMTQRLTPDGQPADYSEPLIVIGSIGAKDIYQPRCRKCHIVLGAPKKPFQS